VGFLAKTKSSRKKRGDSFLLAAPRNEASAV